MRILMPLLCVTIFAIILKSLDPLRSPVIAALDPWGWVFSARQILETGQITSFFWETGYTPLHAYLIAAIASLTRTDAYDVVRYLPVVFALNVIPVYMFAWYVFRSPYVAASTAVLTITARYYFMRSSIGIPEGFGQLLLMFTLLCLLRSLESHSRRYAACTCLLMTLSILYYHLTFAILAPFLIVISFLFDREKRKKIALTVAKMSLPAIAFSALVWYGRVASSFITTYAIEKGYYYPTPSFSPGLSGIPEVMAFSIGKTGALALSDMGYAVSILGVAGFAFLLLNRNLDARRRFLVVYATVLLGLTLLAVTLGNVTHIAGVSALAVYLFSWLTVPVAALAAFAIFGALTRAAEVGMAKPNSVIHTRFVLGILLIVIVALATTANLCAVNYYKAGVSSGGIGLLTAHYYYKCLTDDEYDALSYLRDNSPANSTILVVGIDSYIASYYAIVSRRTVISVHELTDSGGHLAASAEIVRPGDLVRENATLILIFDGNNQAVYIIRGIAITGLAVAQGKAPAPIQSIARIEGLVMKDAAAFIVFGNKQIQVEQIAVTLDEVSVEM